jgi:hypothetical protein
MDWGLRWKSTQYRHRKGRGAVLAISAPALYITTIHEVRIWSALVDCIEHTHLGMSPLISHGLGFVYPFAGVATRHFEALYFARRPSRSPALALGV